MWTMGYNRPKIIMGNQVNDWERKIESEEQHIRVLQNELKNPHASATRKKYLREEIASAKRRIQYDKECLRKAKKKK